MGLRNVIVRVRKDTLLMEAEAFDPVAWRWFKQRMKAKVSGLTLTEPKRGPKGGFKYAELRGPEGTLWEFFRTRRLYETVKALLAKVKQA
jgi:hypothetical protein